MNKIAPGSIVVGFDGSPEADRAVQWAADQAALEGRSLDVLTVARPTIGASPEELSTASAYPAQALLARARLVVDAGVALARRHRPGLEVNGHALLGDPRQVLLAAGALAHALILGSRGRGVVRSKLGSVSASVSKRALIPVVVCRPGTELKVKRGVLVGVDGTAESHAVIEFAFRQAALRSQPLTIVHCSGHARRRGDQDATPPQDVAVVLAESLAGFGERYPEVHVRTVTLHGHADDRLAAIADKHDLVVIGRRPPDALPFANTATAVLERSHTPIAVVPEAARTELAPLTQRG